LTPLTGIVGAAQALESGAKADPELRDRFIGHINCPHRLTAFSLVDSVGIGVLAAAARRVKSTGGSFVLAADDPRLCARSR
jgi:hypothetical protein